jgi:hypothetical protein
MNGKKSKTVYRDYLLNIINNYLEETQSIQKPLIETYSIQDLEKVC